jgi:hypothetical protein
VVTGCLEGERSSGGSGFDAQFREDPLHVFLHGAGTGLDDLSDFFIGFAFGHPGEHFGFAAGKTESFEACTIDSGAVDLE